MQMSKPTLPVDKSERIHWARVLKRLQEVGVRGIALHELAREFGVKSTDNNFRYVMDQLVKMEKVRVLMGCDRNAMPCQMVQVQKFEVKNRGENKIS